VLGPVACAKKNLSHSGRWVVLFRWMQPNGNGVPKPHRSHTLDPQLHWKPVHLSLSGGYFRLVFQGSCQNRLAGTEIDEMRGSKKHASATSVIIIAAGRPAAECYHGSFTFDLFDLSRNLIAEVTGDLSAERITPDRWAIVARGENFPLAR